MIVIWIFNYQCDRFLRNRTEKCCLIRGAKVSDTTVSDLQLAEQTKQIAKKSENIEADYYFDMQMVSLGYNRHDVSKVFEKGTFARFEPEKGSEHIFGFCIAYKFRGHAEACHMRGWVDLKKDTINLKDIFNNSKITK